MCKNLDEKKDFKIIKFFEKINKIRFFLRNLLYHIQKIYENFKFVDRISFISLKLLDSGMFCIKSNNAI